MKPCMQQQFQAGSFTDNNYHAPTSATTFRDLSKASQSPEEYQLLCNIIELMGNLRRVIDVKPSVSGSTASTTGGLVGDDTGRRAMRVGLQIILGCMRCSSDKVIGSLTTVCPNSPCCGCSISLPQN